MILHKAKKSFLDDIMIKFIDFLKLYDFGWKCKIELRDSIKRSIEKFLKNFKFQPLEEKRRKHRKYLPCVFVEQDEFMFSVVLKTKAVIDTCQYGIVDIVKFEHYKKNLALKIWSGLILKNKGDFL